MNCFEPSIYADLDRFKRLQNNEKLVTNKFEKITMTIMKFRRNMIDEMLSYIWGVGVTSIHRYVKFAAPIIGLWGEQLCNLDTPESFYEDEQVLSYKLLGEERIACQVDGKDYPCHADRCSNVVKKAAWSNKSGTSAFRGVS